MMIDYTEIMKMSPEERRRSRKRVVPVTGGEGADESFDGQLKKAALGNQKPKRDRLSMRELLNEYEVYMNG